MRRAHEVGEIEWVGGHHEFTIGATRCSPRATHVDHDGQAVGARQVQGLADSMIAGARAHAHR